MGGHDAGTLNHCTTLLTRINAVLTSSAMECVFGANDFPAITQEIDAFLESNNCLLRISLEGIDFEFSAREIIANALGRFLLKKARAGDFREMPVIVLVDETHNFLGRDLGGDRVPIFGPKRVGGFGLSIDSNSYGGRIKLLA